MCRLRVHEKKREKERERQRGESREMKREIGQKGDRLSSSKRGSVPRGPSPNRLAADVNGVVGCTERGTSATSVANHCRGPGRRRRRRQQQQQQQQHAGDLV